MLGRRIQAGWCGLAAGLLWASAGTAPAQVSPFAQRSARAEARAPWLPAKAAADLVPLDQCPPALREQIRGVVASPTLRSQSAPEVFPCRPAVYRWLLDHPDQAAAAWRRLGAQCLDVTDRGRGRFGCVDEHGSDVWWVTAYSGPRLRVWYGEGQVRPAALLPLVPVRGLFVLHYAEGRDSEGRPLMTHHAELFVHTDSKTAALVTRLLGASMPRMAQEYLGQSLMFFSALAWYCDQNPEKAEAVLPGGFPAHLLQLAKPGAGDPGEAGKPVK